MAKSKSRVTIKGANKADKQNIAAARAVNKAEAEGKDVAAADEAMKPAAKDNPRNSQATPEEQPNARDAREAAQKLFDKADERGKAEIIEGNQLRIATGL